MDNEGSDGILEDYFLKWFLFLALYQAYKLLSERGDGFSCELHIYRTTPFTFSSVTTNNLLRQLLSLQSVEPSLSSASCLSHYIFGDPPSSRVP